MSACACLHRVALHDGHCCLEKWPAVICHDEEWWAAAAEPHVSSPPRPLSRENTPSAPADTDPTVTNAQEDAQP